MRTPTVGNSVNVLDAERDIMLFTHYNIWCADIQVALKEFDLRRPPQLVAPSTSRQDLLLLLLY